MTKTIHIAMNDPDMQKSIERFGKENDVPQFTTAFKILARKGIRAWKKERKEMGV
jgi:hypothetical protein